MKITFYKNTPFVKSYFEVIAYLLFWISLLLTLICFMNEEEIIELEILRMITSMIIIKNFSLILWSRLNFFVWIFLTMLNLGTIILCSSFLKGNIFEHFAVELITFLISFSFKIYYDFASRSDFLVIHKLKNELEYNKKLINSMSGLHITFSGDKLKFMNDNVKNLVEKFNKNNKLRSNFNFNFILRKS